MKRFRLFAGPNGSGKSTIINQVRQMEVKGHPIDFGFYVNADDIAGDLVNDVFDFSDYELDNITLASLVEFAATSGLFRDGLNEQSLLAAINLDGNRLQLVDTNRKQSVAQLLSNFLIDCLLKSGKKCSMETVFSHVSKVNFMRLANDLGYKVYLYFVATADPDINVARVQSRVAQGGHDVEEVKIRDRYSRSLNLMYDAAQEAYQAFFFDNSGGESVHQQIAHFKVVGKKKKWDPYDSDKLPDWFVKYYVDKQP